MAKLIPRRSPGVKTKVGKSTRNADTRDARDDATIIAWLQRIDMDVLRAAKTPFTQGGTSPRGEGPNTPSKSHKHLEEQISSLGVSATAFNRAATSMKEHILSLATALQPSKWLGMIQGVKDAFKVLMSGGLQSAAPTADTETAQSGKKTKAPEPRDYMRIGDALRGTDATKEISWTQLKTNTPGSAVPPAIRNPAVLAQMQGGKAWNANVFMPQAQRAAGAAAPSFAPQAAAVAAGAGARVAATGAGAGSAAVGAGAAATGIAALASNPIGWVVGAIAAIGAVAIGFALLPPLLSKFGQSVFDANKQFSVSGAMATVIAQQQVRDVMRNMRTGDKTAGSADFLGRALSDLKNDIQPMVILVRNLTNLITGAVMKSGSFLANLPIFMGTSVKTLISGINELMEQWMPKVQGEGMNDWLENVARSGAERKSGFNTPFSTPGSTRNFGGPLNGR